MTSEKLKRRHNIFSQTFGKRKSAAIKKFQYAEYSFVIQVTSQNLIEQAIMKENSHRLTLAYSSPNYNITLCVI